MLLFTPGPTPVPEFVRIAMSGATIHHRTEEFKKIFKETRELLLNLLKTDEVVMFASTGTGAMEAAVTNLCNKKALTINAGKFGERFSKICKSFNIDFVELKYDWDTPADVEDVVQTIRKNPDIDAIFIQICESSGGLRHPVEDIASEVKAINPDIMVVADGITAVGVEPIDVKNIDALIAGSQKALMLPPGLSMVGLSNKAVKKIEDGKGFYFNLATELKNQKKYTTAYTAATTLIIGLKEVLKAIENIGIDTFYDLADARARATRVALEAIGLNLYPKKPATAMTAIIDDDAEKIRDILKNRYKVNIAGGQGDLKGKIFRINHMGMIEPYEAAWVVNAIEMALADLDRVTYEGKANRVFNEIYFEE